MAALLLDIATFLISKGISTADGTDIFRDFTPEKPDNLVVLNEYRGDPAVLHDEAVHRSVQIVCRNNNADSARQKALAVCKLLITEQSEVGVVSFTGSRWGQVHIRQTPFRLKTDENNRVYYAFNIGITTNIE